MAGPAQGKVTPRRELSQKLLGRQARSEIDGSVFETTPTGNSAADMVWNEVTASQFTPRHEEPSAKIEALRSRSSRQGLVADAGRDVPPGSKRERTPQTPKCLSSLSPCRRSSSASIGSRSKKAPKELSSTVDELRKQNELEKERSKQLEKRAAEAEYIAVWLKEELDKSTANVEELEGMRAALRTKGGSFSFMPEVRCPGTPPGACGGDDDDDIDTTRPVRRGLLGSAPASEVVPALGPAPDVMPQPSLALSEARVDRLPSYDYEGVADLYTLTPGQLREELRKSHGYIELKQHEILALDEQNLVLREELNQEKQKVIELKRAANTQKEGNHQGKGDLEMNHWLQEEVTRLRTEAAKLQEKLEQASQREQFLKTELTDLRAQAGKANDIHSQEMGRLSVIVGDQLMQVEGELAQRTRELSQVTDPFLKRAHGLLSAARKSCQHLDGETAAPRHLPPLYDPHSRDLGASFRSILKLLKYIAEVLAVRTGTPMPSSRGAELRSVGTSSSLASSVYSKKPSILPRSLPPSDIEVQPLNEEDCLEPRVEAHDRDEGLYKRWMCYLQS